MEMPRTICMQAGTVALGYGQNRIGCVWTEKPLIKVVSADSKEQVQQILTFFEMDILIIPVNENKGLAIFYI